MLSNKLEVLYEDKLHEQNVTLFSSNCDNLSFLANFHQNLN